MAMNKISSFFYHLLNHGGFSFKEGVILVWGDPDIMLLPEAFVELKNRFESKLGEDFFYLLGYVYGKNASTVLIKKYGFNKSDFDKFTNGATQDGFGYIEIIKYPEDGKPVDLVVKGTNACVAEIFKKRNYNKNADNYLSGMIAGGSEPIFEKNMFIEESKCIGKGDDHCIYNLMEREQQQNHDILTKAGIDYLELNKKILRQYMNRDTHLKFLEKKEVYFGDGTFRLRGVQGVILPISSVVLLHRVGKKLLKDYQSILDDTTKLMIGIIGDYKRGMIKDILGDSFKKVEVYGMGRFHVLSIKKNVILIENHNNHFPKEYKETFGRSSKPECSLSKSMLKSLITKVLNKKVSVEEIECIAQGKRKCLFKINIS